MKSNKSFVAISIIMAFVVAVGYAVFAFAEDNNSTPNNDETQRMETTTDQSMVPQGTTSLGSPVIVVPGGTSTNYVPTGGYAAPVAAPAVPYNSYNSLGGLIVLDGLFNDGSLTSADTTAITTTTTDGVVTDPTIVTTTGRDDNTRDLAGLIAVNNLTNPYAGGIGYGAGYGAGIGGPYNSYNGLGGLIVLDSLFNSGRDAAVVTTTTTDGHVVADPTTIVTTSGRNDNVRDLAGLIAVNNITGGTPYLGY